MGRRLLLLLPSTTYRAAAFLAAARALDLQLTVGSDHRSTMASVQPEGLLALDFGDPARCADQVAAFHRRAPLDAVVGVDDDTTVLAAHASTALGLPHIGVAAAEAARDKHRQRVLLRDAGVPVPAFALHRFADDLAAIAGAASYPCVLKPTQLSASRGVIRADDPAAFVAAARRIAAILEKPDGAGACGPAGDVFLAERFVAGAEVALEGLVLDGRFEVLALFDKPDPLDGPFFEETIYVTPSRLEGAAQEAIVRTAAEAAAALGIVRGPVHAELRWNEAGAWLIEMAARPIGGRCSAVLRFGPDAATSLESLVLRSALGERPTGLRRETAAAAVMMVPTPRAGVLEAVDGLDAARAVPHVEDVVVTAHPGQVLTPLPESARYLGFIFARADGPAVAESAVREAHARLTVRYRAA